MQQHQLAPSKAKENQHAPSEQPTSQRQSTRMKKQTSAVHQRAQGSQQQVGGQHGPPISLPLLEQPKQSRNNELGVAKTQKTPQYKSKDKSKLASSPFSGGKEAKIGLFDSIPEVISKSKLASEQQQAKTPQKTRGSAAIADNTQNVQQHPGGQQQNHGNQNTDEKGNIQSSSRKVKRSKSKISQAGVNGEPGEVQLITLRQHEAAGQAEQPLNDDENTLDDKEMISNDLQGSESKLSKYDRMIQSLEEVATKQRRTTTNHGSAKKIGNSTEATDPHEHRIMTLSISSGISKNTGSNTIVNRERLAQLQLYQQQQQMLVTKQQIFDRNRPWNCDYCQPKQTRYRFVDKKLDDFSRKCLALIVSRFMIKEEFYESRKVVELLNTNSRSVLVAQFKDYLIYDDIYEFLTSLYDIDASLDILTRHAVFYDSLSSLEVLCQYREDQIRDRHLVLHGLKPCYVGLEKQIQEILCSNLRNKLRLILNQVRKVQLARGITTDTSQEDSGYQGSSQQSSHAKTPRSGLTALQRAAVSNAKKKTDFKKLIQSSMVKDYNFSRSQSGLLVARDITGDAPMITTRQQFGTNQSINFTNISFEGEIEMLKGSIFEEESFDREVLFEGPQERVNNENIESQYMNAQMILDDLSSRPLTRQSIQVDNTATPASRINMYELHKQEDHKIRLPFCLAPEKPLDQNSSSASMASLHISKDVMKIINKKTNNDTANEELMNYGQASAVANKEPDCSKEQDSNHPIPLSHPSEAQDNLTESGEKQTALNFSNPFKLPAPLHETDEVSIRLPEKSGASKDTVPFDSQRNEQVKQRLPAGLLQASTQQVINFDPQFRCAITETTPTSPAKDYELKLFQPQNDSSNSQNQIVVHHETQQNEDFSSQDLNLKQTLKYQHPSKAISKVTGNGKATTTSQPISLKETVLSKQQKKQKKNQGLQQQVKVDDGGIFIAQVVTPENKRSFNRPNGHKNQQQYPQQHQAANSKAVSGHPPQQLKMRGGSPLIAKDGVKAASPAVKNFNMHQFKLMSSSTRTLPTAQLQSRQIAAKKLNLMKSSKQQLASVASDGSQREIFQSLPRMTETSEKEKIKMSRKLMAQLKKDIQLSPSQYKSQQQLITDKYDTKKDKKGSGVASAKHLQSQAESPVIHAVSRQATSKNLPSARTAYEITFKTCATTIQNSAGKQNKQSSASKRNDARGKSSVQRRNNAVAGSAQIMLNSGENAFEENAKSALEQNQLCLSQDIKHNQLSKNQQRSLKEQVIIEAMRKQQQCSSNEQLLQCGKTHGHQLMNQYSQSQVAGVATSDAPQQNDSKVNKLVRTQTIDASEGAFLPQSKSTVVANKVDLLSIAGKLKILGQQPIKNKNGTVISSSIQRQNTDNQCRKTLKMNSRKISIEQRDDVQFSQNKAANASQKRQNSLRYLSADLNLNHLSGSAESSQQLISQQQSNQLLIDSKLKMSQAAAQQQMMKKIAVHGSSNRKLIIPSKSAISQQPEAFATARNRPNVMISPCVSQPNFNLAQQQTAVQYSQNQFQSSHQQLQQHQVHSRNNGQSLASESGSLDQRQMSQLKMVTKTLNELQKQNNGAGTKRGNSNHNIVSPSTVTQKSHTATTTTGVTTGAHNSSKKRKIQKLNRAGTGAIVSSQVVIESLEGIKASGTSTNKQSFVTPRPKNVKDGGGPAGESKSRNMPLGTSGAKGGAMTQGQPQRMVTFQNGGHSAGGSFLQQQQTQYHSLKQNLTTTKSGQQLYHHGATTLSPSLSTHQHHQNSRNAGLGMVNHHTTTVKQTASLALTSELQEKLSGQGVGAHLPLCMGKTLQSQPALDSTPSVQASHAALTVGSSTPAAQATCLMPPNSLTPLTAAIMKQDAKVHSRKNSATYTRAQGGQKLHTLSHNQLGQVPIGAISMGSGVSKPFAGGPITNTLSPGMAAGGSTGPMKKTKKKQQ